MHVPRTRSAPSPNQTPACRGLVTLRLAGSGQARSRLGRGGEGVSGHVLSFCVPPPYPSPVNGGGERTEFAVRASHHLRAAPGRNSAQILALCSPSAGTAP